MPDTTSPPPPPPVAIPPFPPPSTPPVARSGCMKGGLIGCAGASVLLIVGLLLVVNKAKDLMDWAFDKVGDQVIAACTPEVTPSEKAEFRARLRTFSENVKSGKIPPGSVQAWQSTVLGALAGGKITPEKIRSLSTYLEVQARPLAKSDPPDPKKSPAP